MSMSVATHANHTLNYIRSVPLESMIWEEPTTLVDFRFIHEAVLLLRSTEHLEHMPLSLRFLSLLGTVQRLLLQEPVLVLRLRLSMGCNV